jgi:arylsulfatase A-like enzyme
MAKQPNVVFVFSDQHRAQATGYAGDPNVRTPNLDRLAAQSVNFTHAVANLPVCGPNRATLLTGTYPTTHGLIVNDIPMANPGVSLGEAYAAAGYDTAYIGKWHIDGHGRHSFIPQERRRGFDHWQVLECAHKYNQSMYYGDTDEALYWEGYDAEAQTRSAQQYIREHNKEKPFLLVLAWGPPHAPYDTAPEEFKFLYDPHTLELRPNVPPEAEAKARQDLVGYYGHITALDTYIGDLRETLRAEGLEDDTIFVYTSDHGDMLGSQRLQNKQVPWDESIRVPLLIRYPRGLGESGKTFEIPLNSPDLMPTLLELSGIPIPAAVEGISYAGLMRGEGSPGVEGVLIENVSPFGQWPRSRGGKEYRGVRTSRYTYVKDLQGPWLLYDNLEDSFQLNNLCNQEAHSVLQQELEALLQQLLQRVGDDFLPGSAYADRWGYVIEEATGKVLDIRQTE